MILLLWLACGGEPSVPAGAPSAGGVEAPGPTPEIPPPPSDGELALPTREVSSPAAAPPSAAVEAARARLEAVVRAWALDAQNPWAVGHALLALGPDAALPGGEPAIDAVFAAWAERRPDGVGFPASRGEVRIEPHTDLFLKQLTEIGVGPDRVVTVEGAPATVGDLYRHSLGRTWVDGDATWTSSYNDTPWALQGLSAWAPAGLGWTSAGHPSTMDGLTSAVVARWYEADAELREGMRAGRPVPKRGQGIWAYTCGGAHLYQGAAHAVARGFGTPEDRRRVEEGVPVLFWRLDMELAQIDAAVRQRPDLAVLLLEQRLKFLGHWLETAHKLAACGLFTPDAAQTEKMGYALGQLVGTVEILDQAGVFGRLAEVRAADEQVFLDYVGDAAHALRGLDLATGRGTVRY